MTKFDGMFAPIDPVTQQPVEWWRNELELLTRPVTVRVPPPWFGPAMEAAWARDAEFTIPNRLHGAAINEEGCAI